jgi:hypothetical protein
LRRISHAKKAVISRRILALQKIPRIFAAGALLLPLISVVASGTFAAEQGNPTQSNARSPSSQQGSELSPTMLAIRAAMRQQAQADAEAAQRLKAQIEQLDMNSIFLAKNLVDPNALEVSQRKVVAWEKIIKEGQAIEAKGGTFMMKRMLKLIPEDDLETRKKIPGRCRRGARNAPQVGKGANELRGRRESICQLLQERSAAAKSDTAGWTNHICGSRRVAGVSKRTEAVFRRSRSPLDNGRNPQQKACGSGSQSSSRYGYVQPRAIELEKAGT